MIDVGSSMVGDTSPATSNQKRDPATSVGGSIIEDDILSIDVGDPVTWDTTLTVIVSSPVVKVIALTTSSSGLEAVWIGNSHHSILSFHNSILKNGGTHLNSQKKVCLASHNSVSNFFVSIT